MLCSVIFSKLGDSDALRVSNISKQTVLQKREREKYWNYQMKERDLCLNVAKTNLLKEGAKVETAFIIKLCSNIFPRMKFISSPLTRTTKPALSQGSDITKYFSVTLSQCILFQREYLCFNPHFSYLQVCNSNLGSLLREFQVP